MSFDRVSMCYTSPGSLISTGNGACVAGTVLGTGLCLGHTSWTNADNIWNYPLVGSLGTKTPLNSESQTVCTACTPQQTGAGATSSGLWYNILAGYFGVSIERCPFAKEGRKRTSTCSIMNAQPVKRSWRTTHTGALTMLVPCTVKFVCP